MSNQSNLLNAQTVTNIAKLAALAIDHDTAAQYANDLNKVLDLFGSLAQVDTTDISPLHSPFAAPQPLREDVAGQVDALAQRDILQTVAPAVQDGCYLVPRVIE